MATDRVEQNDLAKTYPEKTKSLVALWRKVALEVDRAPEKQRKPVNGKPAPHSQKSWHGTDKYDDWKMPQF